MSYFVDIVLKSAGLPEKPSYTIPEVLQLLQVSRMTLLAMIRDGRFPKPFHPEMRERKFQEGGAPTKRFYKQALIEYFEKFADPPAASTAPVSTRPEVKK